MVVMDSANRIEQRAKRTEQESNMRDDPDVQEKINDMYVDSIKAKLALLGNLRWFSRFDIAFKVSFCYINVNFMRFC